MPQRTAAPTGIRQVLLETFAATDRMNQLLLKHLDPRAWRAQAPGLNGSQSRIIAEIFAHLHNNRLKWIQRSAPHLKCPAPLDPEHCTVRQTAAAHRRSAASCLEMLKAAFSDEPDRKVTQFSRGSWAAAWPAGATMFAYMFAHDAHHRGQIIMLAHQLGYGLADEAAYGIWRWDEIWEDLGFAQGPR